MRKFFYAVGVVVFIAGLSTLVGGSLLVIRGQVGADFLFWIGLAMAVAGAVISWLAKNRPCQNCRHRINVKAILCPYCGGVVV